MPWTVRILNWREFQHYKRRDPPWIELHRKLLDKPAWRRLPGPTAKLLVDLWMLAAGTHEGHVTLSLRDLGYRLRRHEEKLARDLQLLVKAAFIELAAELQADACSVQAIAGTAQADAVPQTETQTETKAQTEAQSKALVRLAPDDPITDAARERVRRQDEAASREALVFDYWRVQHGHPRAVLDPKRRARIRARLVESGGDPSDCLFAIDGAKRDDFLMQRDPRASRKYDGLETILRDRAQVERLMQLAGANGTPHTVLLECRVPSPEGKAP